LAIGGRREALKDTTLAQYRADLDRRLDWLLSGPEPKRSAARRLFRAMRRDRLRSVHFVTRRGDQLLPRRVGRQGLRSGRERDRNRTR
jgi:hypothetical protein